ncbi:MAG: hypothetical protein M3Y87_28955 [Myxococcota bacterium]|nr:hypothetical protein [Myxococcota bacterium]
MPSDRERWTGEAVFACFAPESAPWSPWVKPVAFAEMPERTLPALPADLAKHEVSWAPEPTKEVIVEDDAGYRAAPTRTRAPAGDRAAIVVDLPGVIAATVGLALIARGYRPVPLFNGASGGLSGSRVAQIGDVLAAGARVLVPGALPDDAPPAFLLDAQRFGIAPAPGQFDGRWIVFPQDFPSANALRARGISRVIWRSAQASVDDDLAHVMRGWQQQGVSIWRSSDSAPLAEHHVDEPSAFRSLWRRAAVIAGLRRNAAGGFGAMVPVPSQSSGGG